MKNKGVVFTTQAAMIAAIYVVLTVVFAPFSFGSVQVRIAEAQLTPDKKGACARFGCCILFS